jgi:hypothetical protein
LNAWQRWRTELPALQKSTRSTVVVRTYSLDPEYAGRHLAETKIGDLQLNGAEWIFVPYPPDSTFDTLK